MEKDRADGIKTKDQDTNTDAVRPARTRTLHGEHDLPQPGQRRAGHPKSARADMRQAARDIGRPPEASQTGGHTRPDTHKMTVHFVWCSGGEFACPVLFAGEDRTDTAVQGAAPLSAQALRYTRPAITPYGRPDSPVQVTEGRRFTLAAQHSAPLCH